MQDAKLVGFRAKGKGISERKMNDLETKRKNKKY
jgi:hypothetical protein